MLRVWFASNELSRRDFWMAHMTITGQIRFSRRALESSSFVNDMTTTDHPTLTKHFRLRSDRRHPKAVEMWMIKWLDHVKAFEYLMMLEWMFVDGLFVGSISDMNSPNWYAAYHLPISAIAWATRTVGSFRILARSIIPQLKLLCSQLT